MVKPHPIFQRILVGTDGTPGAEEAVSQGARLARITAAGLEIVHVLRPPGPVQTISGPERLEAAEAILLEAGRRAEKEEVEARLRLLVGEPADMLAREAAGTWCDLVCVGPDAAFLEKPHLLGGVAAHLVHGGTRPVLVARAPGREGGRRFPTRVLVAVDGSESSMEAVRLTARIAEAADAELRIAHVVPVSGHGGVGWTSDGHEMGFEPLGPAVQLARDMGVSAAREICLGRPGPTIARLAEEWDADVIAVGTHRRNGIGRLALGSVSDWVVRHAGRSVLVARRPAPR
jgi:nucleotide-binding universal stress UspA family protein